MIRITWQASGIACLGVLLVGLAGCGGDGGSTGPSEPPENPSFSGDVLPVMNQSCNTSSCHNSSFRAADLALESFAGFEAGSRYGATIVPFYAEKSHFWLHTTGAIEPRMPLGLNALPDATIEMLRRWIDQGARDDSGKPMYSSTVRKAFVACQGENVVAIVDTDTGLTARYLEVDAPHAVFVDRLTRRLYVSRFETATDNIHVYDADTYELLTTGEAGTFPALMKVVRPAGGAPQLWVTNFDTSGSDDRVRVLDPTTLAPITSFALASGEQPHGIAVTADQSRVYICNIKSATISIFDTTPVISVATVPVPLPTEALPNQPQQCVLSADESHLFVGALGSDKLHVMRTSDNTFIASVSVGDAPWNIALSPNGSEVWTANWLGNSVSVVDVTTPASPVVTRTLTPTHPVDTDRSALQRPIGIGFSPDGSSAYVTSANDDGTGTGHHPPPDGEKNPGNVVIFDATTYQVREVPEVPNFARFVSFLP